MQRRVGHRRVCGYDRRMPLIRCPRCGQAYDLPGVIAVRLPSSIATCHCGEWLSGSKAAVLARTIDADAIRHIDLQQYRVEQQPEGVAWEPVDEVAPEPRSVRIVARGSSTAFDRVFTIHRHPLWIGSRGCHVELAGSELSIRHCSIAVRGDSLVIRDNGSHTGTFVDGRQIDELALDPGVHLVRLGTVLLSVETTEESGTPVEVVSLTPEQVVDESQLLRVLEARAKETVAGGRPVLVCVDGALSGQEFEIPPGGLVIGREGHVRVPDEYLSRKHFEVVPDSDGQVRVRDLGSRNGTFLNTLPAQNTRVRAGDEIRAGVNRFRIEHRP